MKTGSITAVISLFAAAALQAADIAILPPDDAADSTETLTFRFDTEGKTNFIYLAADTADKGSDPSAWATLAYCGAVFPGETTKTVSPSARGIVTDGRVTKAFLSSVLVSGIPCYPTNGLAAHWDAIDNEGYGRHNPDAPLWKDLSGNGHDIVVSNYFGTQLSGWTPNALLAKCSVTVPLAPSALDYASIEILARHNGKTQMLFSAGDGLRKIVAVSRTSVQFYNAPDNNYAIRDSVGFQAAAVYPPSAANPLVFTDGLPAKLITSDTWNTNTNGPCLGRGVNDQRYAFTGEYHAFRLYDRLLSAAEIADNARTDRLRFLGGFLAAKPVPVAESPAFKTPPAHTFSIGKGLSYNPDTERFQLTTALRDGPCTLSAILTADDGQATTNILIKDAQAGNHCLDLPTPPVENAFYTVSLMAADPAATVVRNAGLIFNGSATNAGDRADTCIFKRGKVNFRLGVVSDVHVRNASDHTTEHLIRAFEYFRDNGADAVMIAGDIADQGQFAQLNYAGEAWDKVFPNDKAPDGRPVVKLFVYGNHDAGGEIGKTDESRSKAWKDAFHEDYEPILIKEVKGYKIIGCHWGCDRGLEAFFKEHAGELRGSKPFFYTQHAHPRNTCIGTWAWGHDGGLSTRLLSQFPNAVAFSGHSHYTLTDERTVWQGTFTSVNTSSMRYSSSDYNLRDNITVNSSGYREWQRSRVTPRIEMGEGKQGMLVEVSDDALVIHRREFTWGQDLGDDWIVPLPATENSPLAFDKRSARRSAPAFAANAAAKVRAITDEKLGDLVEVTFPAAETVDNCRVFEYEVAAILTEDDVEIPAIVKRVMAPDFFLPANQTGKPGICRFRLDELPPNANIRFEIRPLECFGKKGEAICVIYKTSPVPGQ